MIILGIDPGSTTIGYGLIEDRRGAPYYIDSGLIQITSLYTEDRLLELYQKITELIRKKKPNVVAVEKLFFQTNQKTAMAVAESRGVIILTTTQAHLTFYEYTPLQVKKMVTGDGSADKAQVKKMVGLTLKETANLRARDDVFDAIAIALTCFFQEKNTLYKRSK